MAIIIILNTSTEFYFNTKSDNSCSIALILDNQLSPSPSMSTVQRYIDNRNICKSFKHCQIKFESLIQ